MTLTRSAPSPTDRWFHRIAASLTLTTALCVGSAATAQQNPGGQDQGNAASGGSGARFEGSDVDMSAFEGVQRNESSIGTSTRQGFGVQSDSASGGGTPGGAAGGGGGLGGFGGGMGGLGGLFGGLGGNMGNQQGSSERPVLRTRLRAAVEVDPLPETLVQRSANRVLNAAPPRSGVGGVNVTMQGRTAILTGTVATAKERRMSELMIRLEPGVSRIENRVQVVGN